MLACSCLLKEIDGVLYPVNARVVEEKPLPGGFYRLVDNHYIEVLFDRDGCYCLVPSLGGGYGFPVFSGKTGSRAILAWGNSAYRVEVDKDVDAIQLSKQYPGWPIYRVCPMETGDLKLVGGEYQGQTVEVALRRVLMDDFLAKMSVANSEMHRSWLKETHRKKLFRIPTEVRVGFRNTKMSPMLDGFPW